LISLANGVVGWAGGLVGFESLTIDGILGSLLAPVAWMLGVPWTDAGLVGQMIGVDLVLNEFVAFAEFGPVAGELSDKTAAIVTFALTGFANIGSLGILLGGLGGIAPERRPDIASLGLRAILAATLANLMSAAIAGILIG